MAISLQECDWILESLKHKVHPPDEAWQHMSFQQKNSIFMRLRENIRDRNKVAFIEVLQENDSRRIHVDQVFELVSQSGNSLLHEAMFFRTEDIAHLIMNHYADLLIKKNKRGDTPLHVLCHNSHFNERLFRSRIIEAIISKCHEYEEEGALPEGRITQMVNEKGNTALHEAIDGGNGAIIRAIFEADARVMFFLNKKGHCPLYMAVMSSQANIVNILLGKDVTLPEPEDRGSSPLHAAIDTCNREMLNLLKEKRDLLYWRDESGGTALHFAASTGYIEGIDILLEADPELVVICDRKGNYPIHLACKRGDLNVLLKFEEKADDLRLLRNEKGQDIFHAAAKSGRDEVVKHLLRKSNLDFNQKDHDGNTALHLAARKYFPKVLLTLTREKKIDLNLRNDDGLTAFDIAKKQLELESLIANEKLLSYLVLFSSGKHNGSREYSVFRKNRKMPDTKWVKTIVKSVLLIAGFMYASSYGAALTISGGFYGSDDPKKAGLAILGYKNVFQTHVLSNAIAFLGSSFAIVLMLWGQFAEFSSAKFYLISSVLGGVAFICHGLSFWSAISSYVPHSWLSKSILAMGIMTFILIVSFIGFGVFPLKYYRLLGVRKVLDIYLSIYIWLLGDYPRNNVKKLKGRRSMCRLDDQVVTQH